MIADEGFAGAGGWSLAAGALGIEDRGIENMPQARATRDAAGLTTIHDDVWTFEPDGRATGKIDSPPCPTFSAAGKGTGRRVIDKVLQVVPLVPYMTLQQLRASAALMDGDERTALVLTPLWFLTHYPNYRWATWEQVPAVLPLWEACAEVLREGGWNVWTGKLYSEQYGVPQTRIRAFLLGNRDREVTPPVPTHSRYYSRSPEKLDGGVQKWVSMAEALGWGLARRPSPTVTGGGTETGGAEPIAKWEERWASHPDFVVKTGVNSATLGPGPKRDALMAECHKPQQRSVDAPSPTITSQTSGWKITPAIEGETEADCQWVHDRPSPTVVGTFAPDVVAKPGYRKAGDPPRQKTPGSVRVTVEEAGVLQSFPASYPWQGTKGKQYLQAGNAVPPLMAMHALAAATGLAVPSADAAKEAVA